MLSVCKCKAGKWLTQGGWTPMHATHLWITVKNYKIIPLYLYLIMFCFVSVNHIKKHWSFMVLTWQKLPVHNKENTWSYVCLFHLPLQHICCDCKKSFCALCSVLQENLRCCTTCHLLRGTAFQRPRLMQLRVKDLRQYLLLRNISTDTCREKEDLVDLVLCHQGTRQTPRPVMEEDEEEDEEEDDDDDTCGDEEEDGGDDTDSLHSLPHSRAASPPPSATRSASEQSALSASQGDVLSPSDSSGTPGQVGARIELRAPPCRAHKHQSLINIRRTSFTSALILSTIINFKGERNIFKSFIAAVGSHTVTLLWWTLDK